LQTRLAGLSGGSRSRTSSTNSSISGGGGGGMLADLVVESSSSAGFCVARRLSEIATCGPSLPNHGCRSGSTRIACMHVRNGKGCGFVFC
jgi:hypothetical protein